MLGHSSAGSQLLFPRPLFPVTIQSSPKCTGAAFRMGGASWLRRASGASKGQTLLPWPSDLLNRSSFPPPPAFQIGHSPLPHSFCSLHSKLTTALHQHCSVVNIRLRNFYRVRSQGAGWGGVESGLGLIWRTKQSCMSFPSPKSGLTFSSG